MLCDFGLLRVQVVCGVLCAFFRTRPADSPPGVVLCHMYSPIGHGHRTAWRSVPTSRVSFDTFSPIIAQHRPRRLLFMSLTGRPSSFFGFFLVFLAGVDAILLFGVGVVLRSQFHIEHMFWFVESGFS